MSRHHGPHTFKAGDEIAVISGNFSRIRYPGIVDRVTPTQVHVIYDASRTNGTKAIRRTFWGASGTEVGGFSGGSQLDRRKPDETFL